MSSPRRIPIQEKIVDNFPNGIIDTIESKDIPDGASSASLNWVTKGDRIELRGGQIAVGTESTSAGKITGLFTAIKPDGSQITFRKNGLKLEYFDAGATDWAETGTNIFPAAALNDEASFASYNTSAGNQLFVSSPNSGLYKIITASPSSYQNMSDLTNFSGQFRMKITQNRMLAWGRPLDKTGMYGSYIDEQNYVTVSNEDNATGNGSSKTFGFTLSNAAIRRTFFAAQVMADTGPLANITKITKATSAQVTANGHGLSANDQVIIQGLADPVTPAGTVSASMGSTNLVGVGTQFTTQLSVGSVITVNSEVHVVGVITDDTHLVVTLGFLANCSGVPFTADNMDVINGKLLTVVLVIDANNFTVNFDTSVATSYSFGGTVGKAELFTDDYLGHLKSPVGGTGTINYTTGAISVTFNGTPQNGALIISTYQYEDSTNHGICDFTHSTPRNAGEGFVFRQDDEGSDAENSFTYNFIEYGFHKLRTWALNITTDDTAATNDPYRARIGISNYQNGVATATGIYFINDIDLSNIKLQKLALNTYSTDVVPSDLSKTVDKEGITLGVILDGFSFDQAAMFEYGDLILCACRTSDSETNNRVIAYNKLTGAIDYHDFTVSCFAINGTELWAGDSTSPNVYKIFSGFDDNNAAIVNYWQGKEFVLGGYYLTKLRKLILQGEIAQNQSYNVYASIDDAAMVLIGTISGSGPYVDAGQNLDGTIGDASIGSTDVGGVLASPSYPNYEHALPFNIGKFVRCQLYFQALGVGYLSISQQRFYDIQMKSLRPLKKYN